MLTVEPLLSGYQNATKSVSINGVTIYIDEVGLVAHMKRIMTAVQKERRGST